MVPQHEASREWTRNTSYGSSWNNNNIRICNDIRMGFLLHNDIITIDDVRVEEQEYDFSDFIRESSDI